MKIFTKYSMMLLIALLVFGQSISNCQLVYSGIEKDKVNQVYAEQRNPEWCWAASVQFVLSCHGVKISQEDIIKRSFLVSDPYDILPAWQENFTKITRRLNNWVIKYKRKRFTLSIKLINGAPKPEILSGELKNMMPVIIAYKDSLNNFRPVVCTAIGFLPGYYGPVFKQIMVRDTSPNCISKNNDGRFLLSVENLTKSVSDYWVIRIK